MVPMDRSIIKVPLDYSQSVQYASWESRHAFPLKFSSFNIDSWPLISSMIARRLCFDPIIPLTPIRYLFLQKHVFLSLLHHTFFENHYGCIDFFFSSQCLIIHHHHYSFWCLDCPACGWYNSLPTGLRVLLTHLHFLVQQGKQGPLFSTSHRLGISHLSKKPWLLWSGNSI